MINRVFRLVGSRKIEVIMKELELKENEVIVRPTYLSICAADERYYFGRRKKEILRSKLPMALIHEAMGRVLYDPTGEFSVGDYVVMIPNVPGKQVEYIKENYLKDSKFKSSGIDGFMQDVVAISGARLIKIPENDNIYVLSELLSVAYNAISQFEKIAHLRRKHIGVWGDGSVGFAVALALKYTYPDMTISVIGKHSKNLQYFAFADETYLVDELPGNVTFDHCFECVGGDGSIDAIDQMIAHIEPAGSVAMLGVSENKVPIDTRMILEKGLVFYGNSRSSKEDFQNAVNLIKEQPNAALYLNSIISQIITVNEDKDIYTAFERNKINDFKTILKWRV